MKTGNFYIVRSYCERRDFDDLQLAEEHAQTKRNWWAEKTSQKQHADTVKITTHQYPVAPTVTGYTPEQTAQIHDYIVEHLADAVKTGGFIECAWSAKIVQRGSQPFAVFGGTAYELLGSRLATIGDPIILTNDESEFHYVPVLVDGKMFRIDPEEGHGGLLYLMRCTKRRGVPSDGAWMCSEISTGWLRTEELILSNQEILEHIADEIDSGATYFTGGVPGWA